MLELLENRANPVLELREEGPPAGGKKPWKSRERTREKEGDQKKESTDGGPIQCSNCGKKGHLSKNCWRTKRRPMWLDSRRKSRLFSWQVHRSYPTSPTSHGGGGNQGSIRGGRAGSFHGKCIGLIRRPQLPMEVEVINDGVTAPPVRVKLEEDLQLGSANSTEGGASVRSDRREGRAT